MKILVTGSAGHLGEGLMRVARERGLGAVGLDRQSSPFTEAVGSLVDREFVRSAMSGIDAVLHTATLHKPHVATHTRQDFVDTNITGTLNLLGEAVAQGVRAFIFTSTTSVFGDALVPAPEEPAAPCSREEPPEEGGAQVAEVEITGRARGPTACVDRVLLVDQPLIASGRRPTTLS